MSTQNKQASDIRGAQGVSQRELSESAAILTGQIQAPHPGRIAKAASAFRTISEVADELGVQQHVLRFWETKFSQIRPLKRGGGRRYYRPEDLELLRLIHRLLYTEGYTIKGAQKLLREQGKKAVLQQQGTQPGTPAHRAGSLATAQPATTQAAAAALSQHQRDILTVMLGELKSLRGMLGE